MVECEFRLRYLAAEDQGDAHVRFGSLLGSHGKSISQYRSVDIATSRGVSTRHHLWILCANVYWEPAYLGMSLCGVEP